MCSSESYDEEIRSWEQDCSGRWNNHRWCQDLWDPKAEGLYLEQVMFVILLIVKFFLNN